MNQGARLLCLPLIPVLLLQTGVLHAQTPAAPAAVPSNPQVANIAPGPKPPDVPLRWKPFVGEYGGSVRAPIEIVYIVAEKDGYIEMLERVRSGEKIRYQPDTNFPVKGSDPQFHGLRSATNGKRVMQSGDVIYGKITPDADARTSILIKPIRPVIDLRTSALASSPPREEINSRSPDLVELAYLDSSIHLDIRYATENNFLGTPVYSQARAFMQRPAAEALVRVSRKLQPFGYGLLIHDAYRPWYVTKMFWDATPPEGKQFVADPTKGSKHNRGCAADLTLYDLSTGKPLEMPGLYDEMSPRSYPDYPGGTSLQRWNRDLLRRAMESEGFTVNESEWWHFDYKDWTHYQIMNVPFEDLGKRPAQSSTIVH